MNDLSIFSCPAEGRCQPDAMEKIKTLDGIMEMEYTRSPGKILGRFLSELRDNEEILGIRCSNCSQVFVPPQQYCPDCKISMQTYVPMSKDGVIESYTIVREANPFCDLKPPYAYVAVRFTGANTLFWHRMKDGIDKLKHGLKVHPVFLPEDKRTGCIMDIDSFEPAE